MHCRRIKGDERGEKAEMAGKLGARS